MSNFSLSREVSKLIRKVEDLESSTEELIGKINLEMDSDQDLSYSGSYDRLEEVRDELDSLLPIITNLKNLFSSLE